MARTRAEEDERDPSRYRIRDAFDEVLTAPAA
jgi:hypothetical protein